MSATRWQGPAGGLASFATAVLSLCVAGGLVLALVHLLLGTPSVPEAAGSWPWLAMLAGLGLVVGRWWIVPLPVLLEPVAEQYRVFTGAQAFVDVEWPFAALVALVALTAIGSGVLVRFGLNRLAGGTVGPSVVVSLGFVLTTALAPEMIWTAFLDPRPIATLGPPPLLSTTELSDRAAEVPYPVYAAADDFAQPASANWAASGAPAGRVVSDTFSVRYRGADRHGLDDVLVLTSPWKLAQRGRTVWDHKGPNGETEEHVSSAPSTPPLATFEEGGRIWEVSPLLSNGRFSASTQVDGVQVSVAARDRASFDRVAPGVRRVE
ncbi:MAG: hypothetical protein M3069_00535 [Chloroflexota bacterium]|nr:hypothetical protein [Chloroflexota bacterium]